MQYRNEQTDKKRALTKVRKNCLIKRPTQEEDEAPNSPSRWPSSKTVYVLNNILGVIEINRKIYMGWQFLTPYYVLSSPLVEGLRGSRSVTVNLKMNENHPLTKWEYCVKRLESYGDLELATWAHRIKRHNVSLANTMAQRFANVCWDDPQVQEEVINRNAIAAIAMKEIESKYPYRKLQSIANKNSIEMTSCGYSEGLINGMGFTIEDFVVELRKNGFPALFQKDCQAHLEFAKRYIDCFTLLGDSVQEGPEYTIYVYDRDGKKREVIAQCISIREVVNEGLQNTGYVIIKRSKLVEGSRASENENVTNEPEHKLKEFKRNLDEATNELKRMALE